MSGPVDANHCFVFFCLFFCTLGRGRAGWRSRSGREEMEQENPTDAAWSPGKKAVMVLTHF